METKIVKLPSGFWSVWIDGNWIDAACADEETAKQKLKDYLKSMGGKHK